MVFDYNTAKLGHPARMALRFVCGCLLVYAFVCPYPFMSAFVHLLHYLAIGLRGVANYFWVISNAWDKDVCCSECVGGK